jgi:hypothetical protein
MSVPYPQIINNVGSIVNTTSTIIQNASNIIEKSSSVVVKGVEAIDKFADGLLDEMKKNEELRRKAELAKSTYECPAYDEDELVGLFKTAKEKGFDYVIIRSNEIKPKTIQLMQNSSKAKYRFTDPSIDDIEDSRPELIQTCCNVQKMDLHDFVKISFSVF